MSESLGGVLPLNAKERVARFFAAAIVALYASDFRLDARAVMAPCN